MTTNGAVSNGHDSEDLTDALGRQDRLEQEYDRLKSTLLNLTSSRHVTSAEVTSTSATSSLAAPTAAPPEQLLQLRAENAKLRYRLSHLQRAIDQLASGCVQQQQQKQHQQQGGEASVVGECVFEELTQLFATAIASAFPQLCSAPAATASSHSALLSGTVCLSSGSKFADYQCNAAMSLSKRLATTSTTTIAEKLSPRQVAASIVAHVPANSVIDRLDVAGPGFINVHVRRQHVADRLRFMLLHALPRPRLRRQCRRVVIDYCSPNVAKEMHVGHLRSTVIGDCISRLLEYLGDHLVRVNHIGDWGTQFGMLIAHLADIHPDYASRRPAIADLQAFYRRSKQRFDDEPEFKRRAYQHVVQLQQQQPHTLAGWRLICDVSLVEFERVLRRLHVRPLTVRGESFYQSRMQAVVAELTERGMLTEEDGRQLMFVPDCSLPLTVVKSDGAFTYDTSDLAAIKHRLHEDNGDWLIYVVDAGQSAHLQAIFAAARHLGWTQKQQQNQQQQQQEEVRIDHVAFGVVLGEDRKKFKTRSGDTVRLADLLDEGVRRARAKLVEKERHQELSADEMQSAEEAIAYGCIKYADLCHNRNHEYVFSFDKMLDDRGNTAVYLLYSLTRIRSIVRRARLCSQDIVAAAARDPHLLQLQHDKEWRLARMVVRFYEVVLRVAADLFPNQLCDYLYELSCAFTEFYDACQCVHVHQGDVTGVNMERLALCEATAQVMQRCLDILGISTVQRM